MKVKKIVLALLVMLLAAAALWAGGKKEDAGGKPELNLWTSGSDNVRLIFEKLVEEFNKDPEYGKICTLKLQYMPSGGGNQTIRDKMLATFRSGQKNSGIDIAEFGDAEMSAFMAEGGDKMFYKIDPSKIPNFKDVSTRPALGQDFFIPYRGTTVVMAYNSDAVPNPPKTIADLTAWIKDHPGRFAYNSPDSGGAGGSFTVTGVYNFLPPEAITSTDEKWKDQWTQGFNYFKEIHPFLYKSSGKVVYPNKNQGTLDLLASKEIDMAPAWADQAITGVKNQTLPASVKIYQINPPFTGSLQVFSIPTFGSHPNEAHAVIDFMLSAKAQNILLSEMAAIPLIPASKLDPTEAARVKDLDVSAFRIQTLGLLQADLYRQWNETIATLP